MRLKCKECKTVLFDTKTGEINFALKDSYEISYDDSVGGKLELIAVPKSKAMVCRNCGHRISLKTLEALGIPIDKL